MRSSVLNYTLKIEILPDRIRFAGALVWFFGILGIPVGITGRFGVVVVIFVRARRRPKVASSVALSLPLREFGTAGGVVE